MKKNVWILNHHANKMYFDKGGRHYSFAKYLVRKGYSPVIFCSNAEHGTGKLYFQENELGRVCFDEAIDVPFIFIKGRSYIGNGLPRILCMIDYFKNVQKYAIKYLKHHQKPDVIIASSVHPLACVAGIRLAKKLGIKCIVEIRDLWPASIVAYGVASDENIFVKMLYRLERWIYKKADAIIFTMGGGKEYIKGRVWDSESGGDIDLGKVFYINNGIDIEDFSANRDKYQIDDADLNDETLTKIVYVGSIRRANNVGALLDIAKDIANNIKILIWGKGDEVELIRNRIESEKLVNVSLKGSVEKKYIPYIISKADVNIMDMQEGNAITRFGISPNKLFEYIAAEKPIIMYQMFNYNPALDYGIGMVASDFSQIKEYLSTFSRSYYEKEQNFAMAKAAFSYATLTNDLIKVIENV